MSADKKCVRKCQAQDNTLITHFYYDANYELTIFDGNWHPNLKNVFENISSALFKVVSESSQSRISW